MEPKLHVLASTFFCKWTDEVTSQFLQALIVLNRTQRRWQVSGRLSLADGSYASKQMGGGTIFYGCITNKMLTLWIIWEQFLRISVRRGIAVNTWSERCQRPEADNLQPLGQILSPAWFGKYMLTGTVMLICLGTAYGCSLATKAELNSYNRELWPAKPKIFTGSS